MGRARQEEAVFAVICRQAVTEEEGIMETEIKANITEAAEAENQSADTVSIDTVEATVPAEAQEAAAAVEKPEEIPAAEEKTESMEDYSKELEASFRTIKEGDVLTGSVIHVDEEGVTLDLDYYAPGIIKTADLSRDPAFSVMADVHVGDKLQGTVVKKDDGAGNILLSCVEASEVLGWDKLKAYLEEKTILTW